MNSVVFWFYESKLNQLLNSIVYVTLHFIYSRLKWKYRNYNFITFEILVSKKSEKAKHIISNKNS